MRSRLLNVGVVFTLTRKIIGIFPILVQVYCPVLRQATNFVSEIFHHSCLMLRLSIFLQKKLFFHPADKVKIRLAGHMDNNCFTPQPTNFAG